MPEMVLSMDQQSELCDHSIIVATKKWIMNKIGTDTIQNKPKMVKPDG